MNKKDKRLLHEILKIKDKQKKIEELSKLWKWTRDNVLVNKIYRSKSKI